VTLVIQGVLVSRVLQGHQDLLDLKVPQDLLGPLNPQEREVEKEQDLRVCWVCLEQLGHQVHLAQLALQVNKA
jgi:hypothetical protein